MNKLSAELTLSSLDVAEMIGKRHDHLLRDIGKYIIYLTKSTKPNLGVSDFFKTSFYRMQMAC